MNIGGFITNIILRTLWKALICHNEWKEHDTTNWFFHCRKYVAITKFLLKLLSKITHHKDQLRHKSIIHQIKQQFYSVPIDINYVENVTVPVKFELQSLHCSCESWSQGKEKLPCIVFRGQKTWAIFFRFVFYKILKKVENVSEYI